MTKHEVTTHPVFARLTEKYQQFLIALIDNGNNKRAAAHITWKCKDDPSADAMANTAIRNKAEIRYLMDEYFGCDPLKKVPSANEVAALAWQAAQKAGVSDPNGLAKLLDIVIKVKGYATKPADNPAVNPPPAEARLDEDEDLMADLEKRLDTRTSETEVQERSVLPV